jgi:hypothetical protein
MATEPRIKRLRDMVDQLERLPASPDRDRLLSEVRSRAVDVDTGVTPRSMLPMREPEPEPLMTRPRKRERATPLRRVEPRMLAPSAGSARRSDAARTTNDVEPWPALGVHLSLDDTPQPHVLVSGNRVVAPWTLGLRG